MEKQSKKKVVLSGMRPTGKLHLGNGMGALTNWIKLQEDSDIQCFYMVADWHALTTDYQTPDSIEQNIQEMVTDWLAAGLDPNRSVIFRQSWVPCHSELALILSMITPLSWLERNPTYKDQMNQLKEKEIATHGFLGYPILQASDIFLYKATHVPVGEDQLPHLELTREIARRFNHIYKKDTLTEPQSILSQNPKILGIDSKKMSKSYDNCIYLSETLQTLSKKIKGLFTDPNKKRKNDPGHPLPCPENETGCVAYALHQIYSSDSNDLAKREQNCKQGTLGCMDCKKELLEIMEPSLSSHWKQRNTLLEKSDFVSTVLQEGSKKANQVASNTLKQVKETLGFLS